MEEFEIEVAGAPVVFSTRKPPPYNPLNRPKIHYRKPILAMLIYLAVTVGLLFVPGWGIWLWLGWSAVYFAAIAKRTVIWLVHLYQNKASDKTRLKCLFEPSCSEYMILSVRKYGVCRGCAKGLNRIHRCKEPNGGIDYP